MSNIYKSYDLYNVKDSDEEPDIKPQNKTKSTKGKKNEDITYEKSGSFDSTETRNKQSQNLLKHEDNEFIDQRTKKYDNAPTNKKGKVNKSRGDDADDTSNTEVSRGGKQTADIRKSSNGDKQQASKEATIAAIGEESNLVSQAADSSLTPQTAVSKPSQLSEGQTTMPTDQSKLPASLNNNKETSAELRNIPELSNQPAAEARIIEETKTNTTQKDPNKKMNSSSNYNSFDITNLTKKPSSFSYSDSNDQNKEASAEPSKEHKKKEKEVRERDSTRTKKKSGKFAVSSSPSRSPPSSRHRRRSRSRSRSPPRHSSKPQPSADRRQKSKLSSHLKSIREQKNEKDGEGSDQEQNPVLSNKPKFFIDAAPIATLEDEGEDKKLNPGEKELSSVEMQYLILGHQKAFRTQEKKLLEKLNKFLVEKEELVKENNEEGEDALNPAEDEFNFESRYFMYNPTKVCNRCKRPGHFERWCPDEVVIKCLFCVGPHHTDGCTQIVCFHCYSLGHRARDCGVSGSMVCFRCGKRGHKSSACGVVVLKDSVLDKEKKDENGDIRCMKCGKFGHTKCNKDNKRKADWVDKLYDDEKALEKKRKGEDEDMNLKVLSMAKDVEDLEFEAGYSDDSYENLANFKRSRKKYHNYKGEVHEDYEPQHRTKKDKKKERKSKDKERYFNKKKKSSRR